MRTAAFPRHDRVAAAFSLRFHPDRSPGDDAEFRGSRQSGDLPQPVRGLLQPLRRRRAFAETTLRRSLQLSLSPAAGVLAGRSVSATISIEEPAASPLTITFERALGRPSPLPHYGNHPGGDLECDLPGGRPDAGCR